MKRFFLGMFFLANLFFGVDLNSMNGSSDHIVDGFYVDNAPGSNIYTITIPGAVTFTFDKSRESILMLRHADGEQAELILNGMIFNPPEARRYIGAFMEKRTVFNKYIKRQQDSIREAANETLKIGNVKHIHKYIEPAKHTSSLSSKASNALLYSLIAVAVYTAYSAVSPITGSLDYVYSWFSSNPDAELFLKKCTIALHEGYYQTAAFNCAGYVPYLPGAHPAALMAIAVPLIFIIIWLKKK